MSERWHSDFYFIFSLDTKTATIPFVVVVVVDGVVVVVLVLVVVVATPASEVGKRKPGIFQNGSIQTTGQNIDV